MAPSRYAARWTAGLLVLQLTGFILPFVLLQPLVGPDYVTVAAGDGSSLRLAVGLLVLNGLVTIAIAAILWPVLRPVTEGGALLVLLAGAVMFTLQAVDNAHLLAMLSLSKQFVSEGGRSDLLEAVGTSLRSTRLGVHYAELLSIELWLGALYGVLYYVPAVPRWLAGLGLLTVALHGLGVVLPFYVGYPGIMALAPLMGVSQLLLAARLLTKGFGIPGAA